MNSRSERRLGCLRVVARAWSGVLVGLAGGLPSCETRRPGPPSLSRGPAARPRLTRGGCRELLAALAGPAAASPLGPG
jgi:hypothetical protein